MSFRAPGLSRRVGAVVKAQCSKPTSDEEQGGGGIPPETEDRDKDARGPASDTGAGAAPLAMKQLLGNVVSGGWRPNVPLRAGRRRKRHGDHELARFRCLYSSLLADVAAPGHRDDFPSEVTSDDLRGFVSGRDKGEDGVDGGSDRGAEEECIVFDDVGDASASAAASASASASALAAEHNDGKLHVPDDRDVRNHRRVHALRRAAEAERSEIADVVPLTYRNVLRQTVNDDEADRPTLRRSRRAWEGASADVEVNQCSASSIGDDLSACSSEVSSRSLSASKKRRGRRRRASPHDANLSAAWRVLSATPSPDKEGDCAGTAVAVRDDGAVAALAAARAVEARTVDSMQMIGEMVVAARRGAVLSSKGDGSAETLTGSDTNDGVGGSDVWDYFCDRDIMAMLVDVVASKPPPPVDGLDPARAATSPPREPQCAGPAWTPAVKSQALQTVTFLVSDMAKDDVALFFLLSNRRINDLILSILPLRQWTEAALEEMAPAYCGLLRALTDRLRDGPHLLPFLLDERPGHPESEEPSKFPLLRAAAEVASSPHARSDTYVHQTALHVVLDVCRIPSGNVRSAVGESAADQRALLSHLCQRLVGRHRRITRLTAGPAFGDPARVDALRAELADLRCQLRFVDELLWCGVRAFNVRTCELLLRSVLFRHVLPGVLMHRRVGRHKHGCYSTRPELAGPGNVSSPGCWQEPAVRDADNIGEAEATAQASVVFLGQIFLTLEYAPLLRMVAVATLHPLSPAGWDGRAARVGRGRPEDEYALTQALNAIVEGRTFPPSGRAECEDSDAGEADRQQPPPQDASSQQVGCSCDRGKDEHKVEAVSNLCRQSLLSLLRGDLGDRRFVPAATLLQSILEVEGFNNDVLKILGVLPDYSTAVKMGSPSSSTCPAGGGSDKKHSDFCGSIALVESPFEEALAVFFNRRKRLPSSASTLAIDCGGSLALSFMSHLVISMTQKGSDFDRFHEWFRASPLVRGLSAAQILHALEARKLREASDLSEAIVDLFELEIGRRYHIVEGDNGKKFMRCSLKAVSSRSLKGDPESLLGVRSVRDVASNDVESACFAIRNVLLFRALCAVLLEAQDVLGSVLGPHSLGSRWGREHYVIRTVETADEEVMAVGGFVEARPAVGTDLDVRGRTFFYFSPPTGAMSRGPPPAQKRGVFGRNRRLAEDLLMRATLQTQMELIFVLDPTELFVLRPKAKSEGVKSSEGNRGTILCGASLRSVITAVSDKEWLHIAIRHMENIGSLIKNGSMSLRFDSPGTCLIVRQYLERCRSALRSKLLKQMDTLLERCSEDPFSENVHDGLDGMTAHSQISCNWRDFDLSEDHSLGSNAVDKFLGEGEEEVTLGDEPSHGEILSSAGPKTDQEGSKVLGSVEV